MPVVFLIAIVAVLVGIFFAATGRGGEMAYEHADHAPLDLGPVTAADVALLRPPTALWGYNMQVTDEALDQIARAVRERDLTIAYLQEQLADVQHDGSSAEPTSVPAHQAADSPLAPGLAPFAGLSEAVGPPHAPVAAETPEGSQPDDSLDLSPRAGTPETSHLLAGFWEWEEATPASQETPAAPEAPAAADTTPETPATEEALAAPETPAAAGTPDTRAADLPDAQAARHDDPTETGAAGPPQTPLVLRASSAKAPPDAEPRDATQPSETLTDREPGDAAQPSGTLTDREPGDATQPSEVRDPAQPSAVLAPDDTYGPQGDFNAHDWWAEQREAARQEVTGRPAVTSKTGGTSGTGGTSESGTTSETGTTSESGTTSETGMTSETGGTSKTGDQAEGSRVSAEEQGS